MRNGFGQVIGDRNTHYYHASTLVQRSRNKVGPLLNDSGEWILDPVALANHVRNFYIRLFSVDDTCDLSFALKGRFPGFSNLVNEQVHVSFSYEEIKQALFDMEPFKLPSRWSSCWLLPANMADCWGFSLSVCESVLCDMYLDMYLEEHINETLLVLIPKVDHPESIRQLHPLSLCNVSYKIITKAMWNRLKSFFLTLSSLIRAALFMANKLSIIF